MPNLELEHKKDVSAFRRIAIGTWATAYDPSVYGTMEIQMDQTMDYIQRFREKSGQRLTVTHMVARAIAAALRKVPDANAVLRFNRIYVRKRIGVFMQVVMTDEGEDKIDLSGATIYDVDEKNLSQIVSEVEEKVDIVRQRKDPNLEKSRGLFHKIPSIFLNVFMKLLSFLLLTLNLDLRKFGLPQDPFGSVMITNVGSLGLDLAYAPLVPYSGVGLVLATGEVQPRAVVEDGEIVVRKMMNLNATFDHRFIDGYHAAVMSRTVRSWLQSPDEHFGAIPNKESVKESVGVGQ